MGNFYSKITLVKKDKEKVDMVEDVVVPVVASVVGAGSPSQDLSFSQAPATVHPLAVPEGKVNVKDALQSKLGVLGSMFGGQQITLDRNIHDLNTVDDSLGMKTEVRDPSASSVWQLVGKLAFERGYRRTAMIFSEFNTISKVDMVSFERKGRKEMQKIYANRQGVEDSLPDEDDSGRERLLGKRSR